MTYKNRENMAPHKLDEFGFMDYKKPLGKQQDMRTSTYLGHKIINDTMLGNKIQANFKEMRPYVEDSVLDKHRTSDYRDNFVWKSGDPDEVRNVALDRKINFMKPFYDCKLKFLSRPMRPASSVTHTDFLWKPEQPMPTPEIPKIPTAVKSSKTTIERNKPGYSKYLDSSATTSRLDYCYRSPTNIMNSIAAKDSITFWNWKDIECSSKKVFRDKDVQLCDKLPTNECIKRRCEFTSGVKHVPNTGLITEVRENYLPPNDRAIEYNTTHIQNDITFMATDPIKGKMTEYGVLGSSDCPQKFV